MKQKLAALRKEIAQVRDAIEMKNEIEQQWTQAIERNKIEIARLKRELEDLVADNNYQSSSPSPTFLPQSSSSPLSSRPPSPSSSSSSPPGL